jgi:hypothetical protein
MEMAMIGLKERIISKPFNDLLRKWENSTLRSLAGEDEGGGMN